MLQVEISVSGKGAASAARRAEAALRAVDAGVMPAATYEHPLLIVDPGRWYAAQGTPPPAAVLARTVGLSLSTYGSPALQDDAELGRRLAAICHPDARVAEHLARVGCRSRHVPLGARAQAETHAPREAELASAGPETPRRLRLLARGAAWLDDVRCEHRFCDHLEDVDPAAIAGRARVFLDITADDGAAPDHALLLDVLEAGCAFASERLGDWPAGTREHVLRAPRETLVARACELARDHERAAQLAQRALAAIADISPLEVMGSALAELLADARMRAAPAHRVAPPQLSPPVVEPPPPTVAQTLEHERRRTDAATRDGLQQALHRLRRLEQRLDGVDDEPAADEMLIDERGESRAEVSVLVPCFKATRTLTETLDSVAATAAEPGAPAIELVVVDDASPAGDGAMAVEWAARNEVPTAVVGHGRNRGLPSTRNTALEHARGELVLPLDADNTLRRGGVRRLVQALRGDPGAAFAYGILGEFAATGPVGLRGLHPWDAARLRYGNYIDALALIRREALAGVGGYRPESADQPYQGYEDWDLWCRFAEAGARGTWVPEIVADYRVGLGSMAANLHLSHVAPLADMLERHATLLR